MAESRLETRIELYHEHGSATGATTPSHDGPNARPSTYALRLSWNPWRDGQLVTWSIRGQTDCHTLGGVRETSRSRGQPMEDASRDGQFSRYSR